MNEWIDGCIDGWLQRPEYVALYLKELICMDTIKLFDINFWESTSDDVNIHTEVFLLAGTDAASLPGYTGNLLADFEICSFGNFTYCSSEILIYILWRKMFIGAKLEIVNLKWKDRALEKMSR